MAELANEQVLNDSTITFIHKSKTVNSSFRDHIVHRRCPFLFPNTKGRNIYITYKTNFKAQLNQCEKIFRLGESEITIHSLGAAINRACNLALQLKKNHHGILDLEVNTSTVELIDDVEPLVDDYDGHGIIKRIKSAVHIRVYKTVEIGPLKYAN